MNESIKDRISKLTDEDRLLLEKRLAGQGNYEINQIPIKNDREEYSPMSYGQARIWFQDNLTDSSSQYNIPLVIRMKGSVNRDILEKSLNVIIHRHEPLRTRFKNVDGEIKQQIRSSQFVELPLISLEQSSNVEEDCRRSIEEDLYKPFDLSEGPLIRFKLYRLNEEENVLYVIFHHIISDGWSSNIFLNELSELYSSIGSERTHLLSDLPISYQDYVNWQKNNLNSKYDGLLKFWKQHLNDVPIMDLPLDRNKSTEQPLTSKTKCVKIPKIIKEKMKEVCEGNNVTMFMLSMAVYKILLSRYTKQNDILIGTPDANRNHPDLEKLIGFFVNTVVIRTDLSNNPSFEELLSRIRETTLKSFENKDLPFEKIVEELNPERSLNHHPIFQVVFSYKKNNLPMFKLSNIEVEPFDISYSTSKVDLAMVIEEHEDHLLVAIEYSNDLFNDSSIDRFLNHYQTLMEHIVENPKQKINLYSYLSLKEKDELLNKFNETDAEFTNKNIKELFENQIKRSPGSIAVDDGNNQYTYQELNSMANRIAWELKSKNVGPEDIVGICINRSISIPATILGVIKTGAAYLPLDPTNPESRLKFMIKDANISVLLTESEYDHLAEGNIETILLDSVQEMDENPPTTACLDNLAYIIYTSGSSGKPKAVMVEYRGLSNIASTEIVNFDISGDSRVLHLNSIGFDAALYGVILSLIQGATLYIGDLKGTSNEVDIIKMLKDWKITYTNLSPSLLRMFEPEHFPHLKTIVSFGESLTGDLVSKWSVGKKIYNGYGPTETTIGCLIKDCTMSTSKNIPIGKPWKNYKVYVLDEFLQPVPIGIKGELYISGVGVARGYLGRPELTSAKFIPNPFSGKGDRLYKTNDIVKYLEDGDIEFIGRTDDQFKIRGLRVELGEIESTLLSHPEIEKAKVRLVTSPRSKEKRIIGYIVNAHSPHVSETKIKRFLGKRLPSYMIPNQLMFVDELKLTINGKVDFNSLPDPEEATFRKELDNHGPTSPNERILHDIWGEVLEIRNISIHDNFFDIGGHSLLAVKITLKLQENHNINISISSIFQYPTISELASVLNEISENVVGLKPIKRLKR